VRTITFRILKEFHKKGATSLLLEQAHTPSKSFLEVEAKLFVLSSCSSTSLCPLLVDSIVNAADLGNPPFVVAAALVALSNLQIDPVGSNLRSVIAFTQSDFVVVQIVAVILFQTTFGNVSLRSLETFLPQIMTTALRLAGSVRDSKISEMIDLLIRHYGAVFVPLAKELIVSILKAWTCNWSAEDLGSPSLLQLVIRLIAQIPENHEVLFELSDFIVEFCTSWLTREGECIVETQLIEVLTIHASKLTNPPSVVFFGVPKFRYFFEERFEQALIALNQIAEYLSVLLQKSNFTGIESVLKICEICLASRDFDLIPTVFVILMIVVQTQDPRFEGLSMIYALPIQFLSELSAPPSVLASSFCVISSGLMVDASNVIAMIRPEITANLYVVADLLVQCPLKYLRLGVIGLCILARERIGDSIFFAEKLLEVFWRKEKRAAFEDEEDLEENDRAKCGEEGMDYDELDLMDIEFPNDGLDLSNLFVAANPQMICRSEYMGQDGSVPLPEAGIIE
jgi:hypothetical protein